MIKLIFTYYGKAVREEELASDAVPPKLGFTVGSAPPVHSDPITVTTLMNPENIILCVIRWAAFEECIQHSPQTSGLADMHSYLRTVSAPNHLSSPCRFYFESVSLCNPGWPCI